MEPLLASPVFPDDSPAPRGLLLWTVAAILVIAALGAAFYLWQKADSGKKTGQYLDAYSAAPDNAARLALTKSRLSLPAAAPQLLSLGGAFLKAGNLDAADQAFTLFADHFPHHPLIAGAWLGQAQILAARGKAEGAVPLLERITASRDAQTEGYRPAALLALAQIRQAGKDFSGSRQALEELIAKYPGSAFVAQAQGLLDSLAAVSGR